MAAALLGQTPNRKVILNPNRKVILNPNKEVIMNLFVAKLN